MPKFHLAISNRMSKLTLFRSTLLVATITLIAQPLVLCASLITDTNSIENKFTISSCSDSGGSLPFVPVRADQSRELWDTGDSQSAMTGVSFVNLTTSASGNCLVPKPLAVDPQQTCVEWIRYCDTLVWPPPPVRDLLKVPISN